MGGGQANSVASTSMTVPLTLLSVPENEPRLPSAVAASDNEIHSLHCQDHIMPKHGSSVTRSHLFSVLSVKKV